MPKILSRIIATALFLALACLAQTPAVFGRLNWSMTVPQAADAYRNDSEIAPESHGIRIKNVDVRAAVVDVVVAGSATITNITLTADSISSAQIHDPIQLDVRATKREIAYGHFKTLLLEKYGAPTNEAHTSEGTGNAVATLIWKLPGTLVTLIWNEGPNQRGYVLVEYQKLDSNNPL